jgi:phytoene synthase
MPADAARIKKEPRALDAFATEEDHAECRRLHRKHGTTYYFATQRFDPAMRRRVHALYGFVRVPDEWVDNPEVKSVARQSALLCEYRSQLLRGLDGVRPDEPALRAFCDVVRECGMPLQEPLLFLDAMEQDLTVDRYANYAELQGYMRGSAAAVGVMMCSVLGAPQDAETLAGARALGEAMQLTNFLRDIREDLERGRVYLPQDDMATFGITEADLQAQQVTEPFRNLMRFEIARARALYQIADEAILRLPRSAQKPVRLARVLYARILDRIEAMDYDVFKARARTTKLEKLWTAVKVLGTP